MSKPTQIDRNELNKNNERYRRVRASAVGGAGQGKKNYNTRAQNREVGCRSEGEPRIKGSGIRNCPSLSVGVDRPWHLTVTAARYLLPAPSSISGTHHLCKFVASRPRHDPHPANTTSALRIYHLVCSRRDDSACLSEQPDVPFNLFPALSCR